MTTIRPENRRDSDTITEILAALRRLLAQAEAETEAARAAGSDTWVVLRPELSGIRLAVSVAERAAQVAGAGVEL